MFPYLVLRVVRERYLKVTNVKKKPSDPNTSRQNTINSVRGSGAGGVLMAKNLLKKNIIKALIGSSVKGLSLSLMKHILVYISVSKLNYLFYLGKIIILIFFFCCYLLQTNLHKMLKQNMYNVQI